MLNRYSDSVCLPCLLAACFALPAYPLPYPAWDPATPHTQTDIVLSTIVQVLSWTQRVCVRGGSKARARLTRKKYYIQQKYLNSKKENLFIYEWSLVNSVIFLVRNSLKPLIKSLVPKFVSKSLKKFKWEHVLKTSKFSKVSKSCFKLFIMRGSFPVFIVLFLFLLCVYMQGNEENDWDLNDSLKSKAILHSLALTQSLNLARQEHISETCRRFPPNLNLDQLPTNALDHIFYIGKYKLLFCYIPKVRCQG